MTEDEPKKKKKSLGKRLGVYREARFDFMILFIVVIFATMLVIVFRQGSAPDDPLWIEIVRAGFVFTVPATVIAGIIWYLIGRAFPPKTLVLYEDGIQLISKQGSQVYIWETMLGVDRTIMKNQKTSAIMDYKYRISLPNGGVLAFMSSSYPGLDAGPFNQILKKADLDGILDLETQTVWIDPDDVA